MVSDGTAGPIVVGVEGSEHSRRALVGALSEARLRGVGCLLIHARDYGPVAGNPWPSTATELADDAQTLLEGELAVARGFGEGLGRGVGSSVPRRGRSGTMRWYDDYLRWLYRGGRPNRFARLQNRASAIAFAAGIWPKRLAALEVRGRRSGRVISFPVVIADYEGERYLVAMLGETVNWVRNVRAASGRAVLRHGRREAVHLEEVAVERRPAILRRYLALAPGARPHIMIDRRAPLEEFERIAPQVPVLRIVTAPRGHGPGG
jgi:hypothetical protein